MEKPNWSPSSQNGYIEHLENELTKLVPAVKVLDTKTGEVMEVVSIKRTAMGLLIEVK